MLLDTRASAVRLHLFRGLFGLEKENLRVTPEGYFAHTPHPFGAEKHIVRDFCENQTEINTAPRPTAAAALGELAGYTARIRRTLAALEAPELLWPFSNPPYIRGEDDIPIARFTGPQAGKTAYRQYLADRYGRYKMALCGVHINYSFSPALLRAAFAAAGGAAEDFPNFKNDLYVTLAERMAAYGWVLTAVTAASPLLDSSYIEKGVLGKDEFNGMASTRCSELGYWNYFTPMLAYTDVAAYAAGIRRYVDEGLLAAPSELYYPIRLKPRGHNDIDALQNEGVDHIELRMADLNPFAPAGLDERDLLFAQLLLVFLAATPRQPFSRRDQVQAAQNFKNAAHYDLKTVKIVVPDGSVYSVAEAGERVLAMMQDFYKGYPGWVQEILGFERQKFIDPYSRYAWRVRAAFSGGFVQKGLALAAQP